MEWQPNPQGFSQILQLLKDSTSPNPEIQKNIHQQLQNFNNIPDYNKYLVYAFVKLREESDHVRAVAGLLLKNNIRDYYAKMPEEVKQYIKNEILVCVGDPKAPVRRTVASIITTIVVKSTLQAWPNLIPTLISYLESQDTNYVEGALQTFVLICEDYATKLDSEEASGRPLNALIPKFIQFFTSQNDVFRKHALSCVNQFIVELPAALLVNMENYLRGLFFLANDPSPDVRKRVCQAFVTLVEVRIDYLMPQIQNIVQYMILATNDQNEEVALEACEFWSAIAETKTCKDILKDFLPSLTPLLLSKMLYGENEILDLTEDESVPDDPKDIRPIFHKGSKVSGGAQENEGSDDEDEDDVDSNYEDYSEWTIRKCAAAGIDILSTVFGDEFLPILLPQIQAKLNDSSNWLIRESAILALGAVAEGCSMGMRSFLPQLVPYLLALIDDPQPLIRSITCWTLSRYSKWVVQYADHEKFLKPLVGQFLNRILDRNKKVQEAACSAFATLEEEALSDLVPYLNPILQTLMAAYEKYQAKNLLILYDAIGTLADSIGSELNRPELINILMPPLIQKWNALPDDDRNLLPLLECLTSIATALGLGFQNFAHPVFMRCLRLIEQTLIKEQMARQNQGEYPDKEFMICALDLVSGLADGLGQNIESLIANANLPTMLLECTKDYRPDVRQSAFALVGDLAKTCINHIKPLLNELFQSLIKNIHPEYISVCNNSIWAIGEIAIKVNAEDIRPFIQAVMEKLSYLLNKQNLNRNLLENTAITIGRLGYICTEEVAPYLENIVQNWCLTLRNIRDDVEKDSAFRGLCKLIKLHPNGVVKHFVFVCDAIASWEHVKPDLRDMFLAILHGFKNSLGPAWNDYYNNFPAPLRKILTEKYQL